MSTPEIIYGFLTSAASGAAACWYILGRQKKSHLNTELRTVITASGQTMVPCPKRGKKMRYGERCQLCGERAIAEAAVLEDFDLYSGLSTTPGAYKHPDCDEAVQ